MEGDDDVECSLLRSGADSQRRKPMYERKEQIAAQYCWHKDYVAIFSPLLEVHYFVHRRAECINYEGCKQRKIPKGARVVLITESRLATIEYNSEESY